MLDVAVSVETSSPPISRIEQCFVSEWRVQSAITINSFRIPEIVSRVVYNKVINNPAEVTRPARFLQKNACLFQYTFR